LYSSLPWELLLEVFRLAGRLLLVRPARLRDAVNMRPRDVGAIVREKCQSVKLIKLIILIEIDYQNKMGVKGYLYSLQHRNFADISPETKCNSIKLRRS
jgi:hypothetical protein